MGFLDGLINSAKGLADSATSAAAGVAKAASDKVQQVTNASGVNSAAQSTLPAVATSRAPSALGTAPENKGVTVTGGRRARRRHSRKHTRRSTRRKAKRGGKKSRKH